MIGLEPGALFAGRYEVLRSLGAGGMGAVYLACDPSDRDFKVALKLLYPGTVQSNQARERFRNEIVASYRINHPNVVRAYEYFDAEDIQAYAMEYVDGGDLLDRFRSGPMAPQEAADILKQMASALAAIHKAGIIHRDLKPENILINRKGQVKISDFGVARLRGSNTLTKAGAMVGTPKYIAPEYAETGECDERGDIFAVGVMGYEMIAGQSPFGNEFKPNSVMDRFSSAIPPLDSISSCPPQLATIIEKAMKVKLAERYSSATELLADLDLFIAGKPIAAAAEPEITTSAPLEGAPVEKPPVEKPRIPRQKTADDWQYAESVNADTSPPLLTPDQEEVWDDAPAAPETVEPLVIGEQEIPPTDSHRMVALMASGIFFLVGIIGVASMALLQGRGITSLPEGIYSGEASKLFPDDGGSTPVVAWSLQGQGWFGIAHEGCVPVVAQERSSEITCGGRTFALRLTEKKEDGGTLVLHESSSNTEWLIELRSVTPKRFPPVDFASVLKDKQAELARYQTMEDAAKQEALQFAIMNSGRSAPPSDEANEEITSAVMLLSQREQELRQLEEEVGQ